MSSDAKFSHIGSDVGAKVRFLEVGPGKKPYRTSELKLDRIIGDGSKILVSSVPGPDVVQASNSNGLLDAMRQAYSLHKVLELRPDDLWNSIAIAFGIAVGARAEEMRHLFVSHTGQKKLEVELESLVMTQENWMMAIGLMREEVKASITPEIADWMRGGFSTSDGSDDMVTSLALMAGMKKYFSYGFSCQCGLAGVNLLGTVADWELLRTKVDKLAEFGGDFKSWSEMLGEVLDSIVETRRGNVDVDFWQRIYNVLSYGSGTPDCVGWCILFSPFTQKGHFVAKKEYVSSTQVSYGHFSKFQSNYAFFPVDLDNNGVKSKAEFVVGCFGYKDGVADVASDEYDSRERVVTPRYDWFMHTGTMDTNGY